MGQKGSHQRQPDEGTDPAERACGGTREGSRSRITVKRGVIGVIQRQDRYLVVQRAAGVVKPGYWCFPGGHVERGENARAAVVRELREELAIDVVPMERVGAIRVGERQYVLAAWRVHMVNVDASITPAPAEIADYRWLTVREIRALPKCLASNDHLLQLLGH